MALQDPTSLNFGNYSSSLTGVPVSGGINPNTSSSFTPSLGVLPNTTTPVPYRLTNTDLTTQSEVLPMNVTPFVTPDTTQQTQVPQDSYRFGNYNGPSTVDNLTHPRTLGEQPDTLAALSLTAEVTGDVIQNNFMNVTQQINQSLSGGNGSPFQPFSGSIISAYSRFMLQNVSEAEQEKLQVVETFTAFYVFFYGKRPPVYRYSGMLLNDENHKWTNDMKFFYENYFRGTKSAELAAQAVMSYDGAIVSGFLIDMSIGKSADLDKGAPFSFSMLVTNHTPAYFSADITALITSLTNQLANQAAVIQQQLAAINSDVPSEQSIIAKQVSNNYLAPTSASLTGATLSGPQGISNLSATSQAFNAGQ